jgi:hypothetical protein
MGRDQPDPTLIVEGSRRIHPSRRVQGQNYPTTALEELEQREKGTNTYACQEYSQKPVLGLGKNTLDTSSRSNEKGNRFLNPANGNGIVKIVWVTPILTT